jgi:hypothetical protein
MLPVSKTWPPAWADTSIHGTTKRQVAAMFAEEKPTLLPLPLEPFRYYQYGERIVHLDGCVEVEAAYFINPANELHPVVRLFGGLRLLLSTEIEKVEDIYDELVASPSPKHHDDVVAMQTTTDGNGVVYTCQGTATGRGYVLIVKS